MKPFPVPVLPLLVLLLVSTMLLIMPAPASAQSSASAGDRNYRLGTGDLIRIQVFGEDDLNLETRIGDSGVVSYPFLGELRISGLTSREVEAQITDGLRPDYLINPSVTVSVVEYRNFYIYGEVSSPGGFAFEPGLTVRKAVALAGGFTERASRSKIMVVHDDDRASRSNPIGINDLVRPGDTITVEQSFF